MHLPQSCLSLQRLRKKNNYTHKIDSIISASSPLTFNGVVLVSQKGKIKYLKSNGYKDFDKKIPLKTDDQFEIMSNTKQVTAVLILQATEQGKLDLQTPIKKYLPSLTQSWADSVTIHHLLNHTHGITDVENLPLSKRDHSLSTGIFPICF